MTMTKGEFDMLHSYIDSASNYLEFGSGESTIYASNASNITNIDSVESSEKYINENLMPNPKIKNAISTGKLSFHMVYLGETVDWGRPMDVNNKHLWPNYPLGVFSNESKHDLILIDGRFRVACALSCILNAPENCIILIHDFWPRHELHVILKHLVVEDKVDTLGVFRKKKDVNVKKIQSLIRKYQYLPMDATIFHRIRYKLAKRF